MTPNERDAEKRQIPERHMNEDCTYSATETLSSQASEPQVDTSIFSYQIPQEEERKASSGLPSQPQVQDSEAQRIDLLDDDHIIFYIQPLAESPPDTAASAYQQLHDILTASQSDAPEIRDSSDELPTMPPRVPSGPKPTSGRPKKRYKPVAIKVKPTSEKLPEDFRVVRNRPSDCMDSLPELPEHPPQWTPTTDHLTQERMDGFKLDADEFLTQEEIKLFQFIINHHQTVFAWEERERRRFKSEYFPPIKYPVVPHEPWVDPHHPIPPGIRDQLIKLLLEKIAAGVYEPSSSSYRSGWFCVMKKDGKSLRIVHNLQRLNSVTIRDAGTLPTPDEFSETCAGRAVIGALDQFSSYDLQLVHPDSRDYTTFQTPLGPYRLVSLPMGWTNSVSVQHGNLTFILAPEMPEHCAAFIDDIFPLGPKTYYRLADGSYETIQSNSGIRRFIWEYAHVLNRVLQRLDHSGASVSGKKALIAVPTTIVTGYTVSFEGRTPQQSNVQRVLDWPACENVRDVRGFLGTAGLSRLWIKNFAQIAKPLTQLIRKETVFEFGDDCHAAMIALKLAIAKAPCLRPIDYRCGREVILAVDSSVIGVGFVLLQLGEKGERYPARYNSITWNDRESRYSQAKLELYGLWRALRSSRIWIFGIPLLMVEVDAKYIKGMLNNPDVQPNATINRWIAGILLFSIKLRHVPGESHSGADGLSRRKRADDDPEELDDHEDWLDHQLGLWLSAYFQRMGQTLPKIRDDGSLITYPDINTTRTSAYVQCPTSGFFASTLAQSISLEPPIDPETVIIIPPRNDRLRALDQELLDIQDYLTNFIAPELSERQLLRFVQRAKRFFMAEGRLFRRDDQRQHKLVILQPAHRVKILQDIHDDLGHKGPFPTRAMIRQRFWWPGLESDVNWWCGTCQLCQERQRTTIRIPPTVARIATLFQKIYIDTMFMPKSNKKSMIVHARCSLSSYPEFRVLVRETGEAIGRFILEDILCRWGYVSEIVTDNGKPYIAALDWLSKKYGIRHIKISGYNSQANGAIESKHYSVREAIVKLCDDNIYRWPEVAHLIFWAERVTIRRSTGFSPYYLVHGVEPVMPFDLAEATFLVPPLQPTMSTTELIALRARQLARRPEDLAAARDRVYAARFASLKQFTEKFKHTIRDYDFQPGQLVMVKNTMVESEIGWRKYEDKYYGPLVVLKRHHGGSYVLAELDGSVSMLRCAAFRVAPYYPRAQELFDIDHILKEGGDRLDILEREGQHDAPGDIDDDIETPSDQED